MQVSFKLGLRAQEIALLQIKEVARLKASGTDFELLEVMSLPAAYTKGADAMGRSKTHYERQSISFTVEGFSKMVRQIEAIAKPVPRSILKIFIRQPGWHKGKSRDLPMVDMQLRAALIQYLSLRIEKAGKLKPSSPLFISQKGVPYSPNTLQEHMALMLRDWAGVKKASSHSGRFH